MEELNLIQFYPCIPILYGRILLTGAPGRYPCSAGQPPRRRRGSRSAAGGRHPQNPTAAGKAPDKAADRAGAHSRQLAVTVTGTAKMGAVKFCYSQNG